MPSAKLLVAAGVVAFVGVRMATPALPHEKAEAALLVDWGANPPPWPVFIGLNALAAALRGAANALTPPPIRAIQDTFGYHKTMLLYVAQKHKIADLLAEKPLSATEIAAATAPPLHPPQVQRLMFALAAHGYFRFGGEPAGAEEPRWANTALSSVLRRDHPNSMAGGVGHNAEDVYAAWGELEVGMARDGRRTPWEVVYPQYANPGGIWKKFAEHPAGEEQFGRAMQSIDALGANAMVADGVAVWGAAERVIDVGASYGHFLHKILAAYPKLEGVVYDRPPVVELAKTHWAPGAAYADAGGRVAFAAGDFMARETGLPKAKDGDVYLLRYILHDWSDPEVLTILRAVRAAIGSTNAKLVIGESAMPDHDTIGVPAEIYNIDMQVTRGSLRTRGCPPRLPPPHAASRRAPRRRWPSPSAATRRSARPSSGGGCSRRRDSSSRRCTRRARSCTSSRRGPHRSGPAAIHFMGMRRCPRNLSQRPSERAPSSRASDGARRRVEDDVGTGKRLEIANLLGNVPRKALADWRANATWRSWDTHTRSTRVRRRLRPIWPARSRRSGRGTRRASCSSAGCTDRARASWPRRSAPTRTSRRTSSPRCRRSSRTRGSTSRRSSRWMMRWAGRGTSRTTRWRT